jgi:hypothetical protein
MIFTISSLIVLAGCMRSPWLAEADSEGGCLAEADGEGGWADDAGSESGAARSSAPMMIRMPV